MDKKTQYLIYQQRLLQAGDQDIFLQSCIAGRNCLELL